MRLFLLLFSLLFCSYPLASDGTVVKVSLADVDYAPYYFYQDGQLHGVSVDVLHRVLSDIGMSPEFVRRPWTRLLSETSLGRQDLIMVLYKTSERLQQFDYVMPAYLSDKIALLCFKPCTSAFDGSLDSLSGMYIGTIRNNSYGEVFDSQPGIARQEVENEELLFKLLGLGKLRYAIASEIRFDWSVKAGNEARIMVLTPAIDRAGIYFAFGRQSHVDKDTRQQFSLSLRQLLHSPDYLAILDKYNMQEYRVQPD
ncbi:hypothetical protein GCM10009092_36580 [Bowmanella denitrificans]|uniref:Solute-binding protein family 3/N-terminal domain-containing protein n=1 Tax=Bowmanella denitrificans TaxID=366582 RepID=A0ABN0XNR3_9ALTE